MSALVTGSGTGLVGIDATSTPARRRGRPPGKKMQLAIEQLRLHHFSFLRAAIQGVELRRAWTLYLAFEGGPYDERHFHTRLRELQRQIQHGAIARGLEASAHIAFGAPAPEREEPPKQAPSPALPTLDEWILQRCEELGMHDDFQSQQEWLEEYRAEFGLDRTPAPQLASQVELTRQHALPASSGHASHRRTQDHSLEARLQALNLLAGALANPPSLSDLLGAWLSPELAQRLQRAQVADRPMAMVTLEDLIAFANLYGHRWWRHVPRLGAERGARLVAWLEPLAMTLGVPLKESVIRPSHRLELTRQNTLRTLDPDSLKRFAVVPLARLAVPPELDGRRGIFRTTNPNTLGVDTDLDAIQAWLRRHQDSPRTAASYARIVERFYLWCVCLKRKPMSSLVEGDFLEYLEFLSSPPPDWVQGQQARREAAEWRPFKGPLSPASRKLNFSVISGLLSSLVRSGYLTANAVDGVRPSMKLPHLRINIERCFEAAQWAWIRRCWSSMYALCGPAAGPGSDGAQLPDVSNPDRSFSQAAALRRTKLILDLGSTTGLRLIELVTTRARATQRRVVDGEQVWLMTVLGKGNKEREVLIFDDVKALMEQHHLDMVLAGTAQPTVGALRGLRTARPVAVLGSYGTGESPPHSGSQARPPGPDLGDLPLIGALRKPPPRWATDSLGVAHLDQAGCANSDRYGALDPTALYQSLKRFFAKCASRARVESQLIDADALEAASTHWLRHFFATSATSDKIDLVAIRETLGHASLQTTSIYLRPVRTRLVKEMSRLQRRS